MFAYFILTLLLVSAIGLAVVYALVETEHISTYLEEVRPTSLVAPCLGKPTCCRAVDIELGRYRSDHLRKGHLRSDIR